MSTQSVCTPYRARILTAINGVVIELIRFRRPINPHDEAFWFEGRENRTWTEHTLPDRHTITPRWKRPQVSRANKLPLNADEVMA